MGKNKSTKSLDKIPSNFPKFGEVWRHYKGNFYTVIGPCFQESTGDLHIAYQCQSSLNMFVRPFREWNMPVERTNPDIKSSPYIKRFTKV